jgi:hypothetical protein
VQHYESVPSLDQLGRTAASQLARRARRCRRTAPSSACVRAMPLDALSETNNSMSSRVWFRTLGGLPVEGRRGGRSVLPLSRGVVSRSPYSCACELMERGFTDSHKSNFKRGGDDLLIRLGYETDDTLIRLGYETDDTL